MKFYKKGYSGRKASWKGFVPYQKNLRETMLDIFNITRSSHILKEWAILMLWYCQILPALSPKCSMKQIKHTKQIPSPTI